MTNQQGAPEALRPITRYEVVDCIDSKHVPAVIPNGAGPWVRYEDHMAALVEAQQPAPSAAHVVADALADSQYLAGVSAGWNAANADDPNAALRKLHESRAGYLKPLSAARAPADSVTAPAGGVVGAPIYRIRTKNTKHVVWTTVPKHEYLAALEAPEIFECELISTPPAQAADSVLEDAAREAIDKVLALFPFNAPIQTFTIGGGPHLTADGDTEFYSVKRVLAFLTEIKTTLDAARKQGGA